MKEFFETIEEHQKTAELIGCLLIMMVWMICDAFKKEKP